MRNYSLPLLLSSKPADTRLPVDTARFDMRLTGRHDEEQSCALVFDFRNGMAVYLDKGTFEIAVLSPEGKLGDIYQLRTPALKAAEAKAMKYRLPITCDQTGAIIGNGFTLCRGAQDYLERCNAALTMSSAIAVSFSNDVR